MNKGGNYENFCSGSACNSRCCFRSVSGRVLLQQFTSEMRDPPDLPGRVLTPPRDGHLLQDLSGRKMLQRFRVQWGGKNLRNSYRLPPRDNVRDGHWEMPA